MALTIMDHMKHSCACKLKLEMHLHKQEKKKITDL